MNESLVIAAILAACAVLAVGAVVIAAAVECRKERKP